MTASDLARALRGVAHVSLDTSAFIAASDTKDPRQPCALWLLREIAAARLRATVSAVTAAELMVRALSEQGVTEHLVVQGLLRAYPNLEIRPLTLDSAALVATVRARTGLRTPDACVVACALEAGAGAIVHGDRDYRKAIRAYPELRFVDLADHCR